jgi:hypothetical protein
VRVRYPRLTSVGLRVIEHGTSCELVQSLALRRSPQLIRKSSPVHCARTRVPAQFPTARPLSNCPRLEQEGSTHAGKSSSEVSARRRSANSRGRTIDKQERHFPAPFSQLVHAQANNRTKTRARVSVKHRPGGRMGHRNQSQRHDHNRMRNRLRSQNRKDNPARLNHRNEWRKFGPGERNRTFTGQSPGRF